MKGATERIGCSLCFIKNLRIMFDNEGHWIDDPLDVVNAKPDFSGLGIEPKQTSAVYSSKELVNMEYFT